MAEYKLAFGIGSEYVRLGVQPPVYDPETIGLIKNVSELGSNPDPRQYEDSTVFYYAMPEGLLRSLSVIVNAAKILSEQGHEVYGVNAYISCIESDNPFEELEKRGVNMGEYLLQIT